MAATVAATMAATVVATMAATMATTVAAEVADMMTLQLSSYSLTPLLQIRKRRFKNELT
jgi:hypothetical protein